MEQENLNQLMSFFKKIGIFVSNFSDEYFKMLDNNYEGNAFAIADDRHPMTSLISDGWWLTQDIKKSYGESPTLELALQTIDGGRYSILVLMTDNVE